MSANGGVGEGIKHYHSLEFDGNETSRIPGDGSTIATVDIANSDWDYDSVAGGAGGDGVSARRKKTGGHQKVEGVERDKWGMII